MLIRIDSTGKSALYSAYRRAEFEEFKDLAELGENINCLCPSGHSLIVEIILNRHIIDKEKNKLFFDYMLSSNVHFGAIGAKCSINNALLRNNTNVYYLEEILKKSIDPTAANERIQENISHQVKPLLFEAIEFGNLDKINLILKHYPNLHTNKDYRSGDLLCTLMNTKSSIINEVLPILIKQGADPCDIKNWTRTSLDLAAEFIKEEKIFKLLLENITDKDDELAGDNHPFFTAISTNNIDAIKILLKLGLDIDCQTLEGITPLMVATMLNKIDVLLMLKENNANLTITDNNRQNFLHYLVKSLDDKDDVSEWIDFFKNSDESCLLKKDYDGNTPIDLIKRSKHNPFDKNNEVIKQKTLA